MGIRGSSTCPIILNDCQVPVENLLGEIGKGHIIAFNILNIGRFKLGAMCVGGARVSIESAVAYAKQRKAFGKTISEFGLVREKIANMATLIYVGESMVYRTVGMMDELLSEIDSASADAAKQRRKAIEEYAVECSILKVWGSEMIDYVVNETLQIFAGYGFVEEYPAERAYRDARINRIFEGTNEINRLIITGFLLKRAMTGQLPLLPAIKKLMDEVLSGPSAGEEIEGPLAEERKLVAQAKKLGLFVSGSATQKYMQAIQDKQEVMGAMADMTIEIYAMESAVLRAQKMVEGVSSSKQGEASAALPIAMTRVYLTQALEKVEAAAKKVIADVPKATCCGPSWRSSVGCPSTNRSTRLRCASRLRRRRLRQGSTRWRRRNDMGWTIAEAGRTAQSGCSSAPEFAQRFSAPAALCNSRGWSPPLGRLGGDGSASARHGAGTGATGGRGLGCGRQRWLIRLFRGRSGGILWFRVGR